MKTKIYTMQDWERDGVLSLSLGQHISKEVFRSLRDCVPPAFYSHNVMQVGEPYATDKETLQDLFTTFVRNEWGDWIYMGHCLYGKTEHRKGLFED